MTQIYKAVCTDKDGKHWHVITDADGEEVKFDEIQARTVAVILNQLDEQQKMWLAQLTAEVDDNISEAIAVVSEEQDAEMKVVRKLVEDIIAAGYAINVIDDTEGDGERTVHLGRNVESILGALRTTHGDVLQINQQHARPGTPGWARIGDITLVYGNAPWEVVQDHTDSETINKLLEGSNALGAEMEAAQ